MQLIRKIFSVFFGLVALAMAGFAVYLCGYAAQAQVQVPEDTDLGDPTETLEQFFDALQARRWRVAYSLLTDKRDLDLERVPEDELDAMFWEAQCSAWEYQITEGYDMVGTELEKTVTVRGLDTSGMVEPLHARVAELLAQYTEEARLASEVYDENGQYLEPVVRRALLLAATELLEDTSPYYTQQTFPVRMRYDAGDWSILPSNELMRALTGGASPISTQVPEAYSIHINNLVASTLEGILPVKKVYRLEESMVVAPEPDRSLFGESTDPMDTLPILEKAQALLDGQETIWNPDIKVAEGRKIRWYLDDTILSITWQQPIDSALYSISEVKVAHPSQFRRYLADDTFSAARQYKPSEMAKTVNAVTALNGDFHKFRNMGIVVYHGQLYRTAGKYIDTCMVDSSGDLHFVMRDEITEEADALAYIEENDIRFSLAFGPVLLQDGQRVCPSFYTLGEINDYYARSVVCQLGPLHYMVLTVNCEDDWRYGNLATVQTLTDALEGMGVPTAYVLDGGQTAALIMNNEVINRVQFGYERSISDIIYFATAIPSS